MYELHELKELRDHAYARSYDYKLRTKELHDRHIRVVEEFKVGERVLLFNSGLRLFPVKLKSRWSGPFTVIQVFPQGAIEIEGADGVKFKVNGHRLKHYFAGPRERSSVEVVNLDTPPE